VSQPSLLRQLCRQVAMRWVLVLAVLALLATTHGLDLGRKHHRKHHGRRQSGSGSAMKFTPQQLTDARTFLAKNKWAHGGGATDQTFWHWTTMETCIRLVKIEYPCLSIHPRLCAVRNAVVLSTLQSRDGKMSDGEMDFLTSEHKGMRAGGGFYLAHDPRTSAEYVSERLPSLCEAFWDAHTPHCMCLCRDLVHWKSSLRRMR